MQTTNLFSVEGKTAIVTGASSGLGVVMAEGLANAGANVVIAARRKDNLDALAERLTASGAKALAVRCDVCTAEDIEQLVAAAWDSFGRVDILVNNAGVSADAGVLPEHVTDDLFDLSVQTNLVGTFRACRAVARRQLADGRGGSIINIASIMGMAGTQNAPVGYQSAKAGVINLTRALALSWADRGVRVNCIAPGWFPSEMTAAWFAVPQFLARFSNQVPTRRVGDPADLVGPLLFLASDASAFVTGQTIAVDGGLSASNGAMAYDEELFAMQAAAVGPLGERIMPA